MTESTIFVLGLGYVGLPLSVHLARRHRVIGFEKCPRRLAQLEERWDVRGAVSRQEFAQAKRWDVTGEPESMREASIVICAVPTPVDAENRPDLRDLEQACELIGRHMTPGMTVIFESTVFPGATEEICVPILERTAKLTWKRDFFVGYSPERVNPGDPAHGLPSVTKVVAADGPETLERVARLYEEVIDAGVHRAPSIRVAEAAKLVENVQRDVNIALMNELSTVLRELGIDTLDVLEAAETKWNFLPFRPGLVGGHCVAVDPYYLLHAARRAGLSAGLVTEARRINEEGPVGLSRLVLRELRDPARGRVLVLGISFKADCSDLRNSKAIALVRALRAEACSVDCIDPVVVSEEASSFGVDLRDLSSLDEKYDAIVWAVDHQAFRDAPTSCLRFLAEGGIVFDLHGRVDQAQVLAEGGRVFRP